MRHILIAIAILFSANSVFAQASNLRINRLLDYYTQTFQFNGVAFVSVKGKTILNKGYGFKDQAAGTLNDPNSIFQIGSVSKQFTAEVILMLAQEGKLNLDDKLEKYFPDFPAGDSIKIVNLLNHTSGIYNYTQDTLWARHPGEPVTQEKLLAIMKSRPIACSAGEKFDYSNSNYLLLGYIIEQVCRKPYTAVVRDRILNPLGMNSTGFDFENLQSPHKPVGYNCILIDTFHKSQLVDSTLSFAAGALYSTAGDLYKWHRALQSHKLLDREWQQQAYLPFKGNYGYGWMIKEQLPGKTVYAHSGGINGFTSYFARLEREDVCIVLLSNVEYTGANLGQMSRGILRCLYDTGFTVPEPRSEIQLSDASMKRYEGDYVFAIDSNMHCTVKLDRNRMLFQLSEQPQDRMYPETERFFFTKSADAQFEFLPDARGGYKLMLHQHGQKFEALPVVSARQ